MMQHPSRHAVPTSMITPLLSDWRTRSAALQNAGREDSAAVVNHCALELQNVQAEARKQWVDRVNDYKEFLVKFENEARQAAYWIAGQVRALSDKSDRLYMSAYQFRESDIVKSKRIESQAETTAWKARRAGRALHTLCDLAGLEAEEFLADEPV